MGCCESSLSNKPPLRKSPPEDSPTSVVHTDIDDNKSNNSCRTRNVMHIVVVPESISGHSNGRLAISPETIDHFIIKPNQNNNRDETPLDGDFQQQHQQRSINKMSPPQQEMTPRNLVPTPLFMSVGAESNADYPASQARDSVGSGVPNEGNELRRRGPDSEGGSFRCNPDDPLFDLQM